MNQTLCNFFSSTVETFEWWMSAALSVFKLSVQNVHQLQQHMIEVSFEMTGLPYQWTLVAYHSISITRQSSAQQCWSVLACISDSDPASRGSRPHIIIQWIEIWQIRWQFVFFPFLCQNCRLITCSLLKNAHLSPNSYNFWMQKIFQWNLQRKWPDLNPPL